MTKEISPMEGILTKTVAKGLLLQGASKRKAGRGIDGVDWILLSDGILPKSQVRIKIIQ